MMAAATALLVQAALAPVVHHPPDAVHVAGAGVVHVVGEVPGAPDATMDVVLGSRRIGGHARTNARGQAILHAAVSLEPGLNQLEITFTRDGADPVRVRRAVFFAFTLTPGLAPPAGFAASAFHRSAARDRCRECHELTPAPGDAAPPVPEGSTCFSCHSMMTRAANVHGPAAQWACTRCHDARPGGPAYATPSPVMPLCFSCHAEQKQRLDAGPYQHGPTASGHCTICHDPHGTTSRQFLKKPVWELCTTCHAEKASGRHVIAWGPRGQGHPTRGRPDPSRHGEELSCASCHNPHAAPAPRLWNFKATVWLDLCRNCHTRLVGP